MIAETNLSTSPDQVKSVTLMPLGRIFDCVTSGLHVAAHTCGGFTTAKKKEGPDEPCQRENELDCFHVFLFLMVCRTAINAARP